jgi:hypothetical protein
MKTVILIFLLGCSAIGKNNCQYGEVSAFKKG